MPPVRVLYFLLVILINSVVKNAQAQSRSEKNSWNVIESLEYLSQVVGNLSQVVQNLSHAVQNLDTKAELHETLLRNLSAMAEMQRTSLTNLEIHSKMQLAVLNNSEASINLQATTLNNLVTKEDLTATLLKTLQSNVTAVGAELETLSEDFHRSLKPTETAEGIIAGTYAGVFVIPLKTGYSRKISSAHTTGVAFDWNTRKVYWIDNGIKRANLDGTSIEQVISDNSALNGLAVDPVTGNFYYGNNSYKNEIRVCSRNGQNCAVVASGSDTVGHYIYDITLYPSEGIMFWSHPHHNKTVVRANMDGRNARVIISENAHGIWADEASQRLYWSDDHSPTIGSYDLNGKDPKVLLSGKLHPEDVEVDGDTVYFGSYHNRSIYSVTQNGQLALIANTAANVLHIALYHRNKVHSRRNPCHVSACPNVCALNRDSYSCL